MDDFVTVTCPHCGETLELAVAVDVLGSFVQDCDVCCRPWSVSVDRDPDGYPAVRVERSE